MSPRDASPRYAPMLVGLLALTLVHAAIGGGGEQRPLLVLAFFLVLLPALRLVAVHRGVRLLGLVLGASALGANLATLLWPAAHPVAVARGGLVCLFLAATVVAILADVFREGAVTWNRIYGAISAYLLAGFAWAFLLWTVAALRPGSFALPPGGGDASSGPGATYLYLSFITLTTLGYGDVLPVTPMARTLAWLEAVFGQLYLAVLVARLVGLHLLHTPRPAGGER